MAEKLVLTQVEKSKLKRELTLLPLFGLIYFTVCGGSFGAGADGQPFRSWLDPFAFHRHSPGVQHPEHADGAGDAIDDAGGGRLLSLA